jgi:hypothetical protein
MAQIVGSPKRRIVDYIEILAAILGSFLGSTLTVLLAWRRLSVEGQQWRQDALVRGMGFLTGGRQERSVGIGLIEALISTGNIPKQVRPAVDNVLWSQLLYVIYHGDPTLKHERANVHRLHALIKKSPDPDSITGYSTSEAEEVERRIRQLG